MHEISKLILLKTVNFFLSWRYAHCLIAAHWAPINSTLTFPRSGMYRSVSYICPNTDIPDIGRKAVLEKYNKKELG